MELFLRPHDNVSDPVWSVIISLIIVLIGVSYYIYTIMKLAFAELEQNGSDDTTESEELLQLSSSGDQQSS